ncbi:hypothetical protein EPUL_000920 [Erysiphe pulchra]|uniref:Uncharacterized protein n=1 Tax=Erysiphe pulchra TaxID=225359 RepID=A0A2S4PZU9_9PEZI|nr:hypothetical protein EPUL_000920 [Erysiphe pulchra]
MELDVDSIAPSTSAHSTPSASQTQPPFPPLTASSNTVVNEEENSAHAPRTILNPVALSKRAAQYFTDTTSQSPRNEAHQTPAYLPKELQVMIQGRQDQERVWHREIEKKEAEFIRDYIRKAIACLADFRKRCNGYHPTRYCSRAPSCGNCGSCMHSQNDCKAFTKRKNCGGPHRSDSHKFLARPSRYGGPTKEQLKSFHKIGEREYQAVARTKAAEQRATAVTESIVISSSQSSEPSSTDIQQTPI